MATEPTDGRRARRAGLADLVAARPRARRPALDDDARLGRQPEVRGGYVGHVQRRLGPPRRHAHGLPGQRDLRRAARHRAGRARGGGPKIFAPVCRRCRATPCASARRSRARSPGRSGCSTPRARRSRARRAPARPSRGRGTAARRPARRSPRALPRAGGSRRRTPAGQAATPATGGLLGATPPTHGAAGRRDHGLAHRASAPTATARPMPRRSRSRSRPRERRRHGADATGATVATLLPQTRSAGRHRDAAVGRPRRRPGRVAARRPLPRGRDDRRTQRDCRRSQTAPISLVRAATGLAAPHARRQPEPRRARRHGDVPLEAEPARARALQLVSGTTPLATVLPAISRPGAQHVVWNGASRTRLRDGHASARCSRSPRRPAPSCCRRRSRST